MSENDQRTIASVAAAAKAAEATQSAATAAAEYVMFREVQANYMGPMSSEDQMETDAWALVETFDGRLTEAEKRIDRVLARLNIE